MVWSRSYRKGQTLPLVCWFHVTKQEWDPSGNGLRRSYSQLSKCCQEKESQTY